MLKKFNLSALIFSICILWIIPLSSFGLKYSSSYSPSLDYKERPPRPPKSIRSNNSYKTSIPKPRNPSNRVPPYLQDINNSYRPSYSAFINPGLEPFQDSTNDAIRIVDPPKYFQDQKKYFQVNPSVIFDDSNYKEFKKNQNPTALALHYRKPLEFTVQDNQKLREELFYKGPEYLPYLQAPIPPIKPQKLISHKPHPTKSQHQRPSTENPKPIITYSGIQTPNSESIRDQIQSLKEKQRQQFEDDNDEHPARPLDSRKRRPSQRNQPTQRKRQKYIIKQNENEEQDSNLKIIKETEQDQKKLKGNFGESNNKAKILSTQRDSLNDNTQSKNDEHFVPYQMLASVRHTNR